MVETVTWLAGRPDYFDEFGEAGKELDLFGSNGRARSSKVFEWLVTALSYQGISDAVARSYMAAHERPPGVRSPAASNNGDLSPPPVLLAFSRLWLSQSAHRLAPGRT